MIRECAEKVKAAAPTAMIEIDIEPSLPAIPGDRRMIWRGLFAVIENAVKFSPANSPVQVRVTGTGDTIRVVVTDHGIGMSPEIIRQMGVPFLQEDGRLSRRYDGMGLGLALAHTFIQEIHQGTMDISSEPGQGAVVTIELPLRKLPC